MPIIIFSQVSNFGDQSLSRYVKKCIVSFQIDSSSLFYKLKSVKVAHFEKAKKFEDVSPSSFDITKYLSNDKIFKRESSSNFCGRPRTQKIYVSKPIKVSFFFQPTTKKKSYSLWKLGRYIPFLLETLVNSGTVH